MEAKPIVTSHGNQSLFSSLHKPLLEALPKEPTEWRRSYGRAARNVQLDASFVPYDDDILPDDSVKTLVSRLYFHIFWTDCDLETYKQKVKEEISDWCAALKAKNIPDWLIVVVNSDDNKMKTKLLPRSSIYDKIKSDFCSKTPDRIVVLEPLNGDAKSTTQWNQFLTRLRTLLLQAFTRHLQKYEDNMRALREERNKVGWNFQDYFIVQEELAFMFEMLGLYDDALIQYDELDALFTQFILNHASGRLHDIEADYRTNKTIPTDLHQLVLQQLTSKKSIQLESVPWLASLTGPCTLWAGLSLYKPIAWDKRDLIKDNKVTLLEFRNYLFSRQCAILLLLNRPGEIIQRGIDYLHETVQEMKTLDIEIKEGGMDCWVYLSGLEILQKCEKMTDTINPRSQALNTAYLWDYVCRKLNKLGELCGLMPGDSNSPTSAQLSLVVDLTSGMGLEVQKDDDDDESTKCSPRDKLREALSSRETFQRIYLEQSELAMGTFKYIGRFRSARMIGKNLADFYMKLGEPKKAENFLMDAMTSYHQEGWEKLRDEARLELAQCQYQVADHHKYVKTACQVASSSSLVIEDRVFHMAEVLKIANLTGTQIVLKASPLLKIEITDISASKVTVDEPFYISIQVDNTGPCDIPCDSIWLTLTDCASDLIIGSDKRLENLKTPVSRQGSNASLDNRHVMNLKRMKKQAPSAIDLCLHYEGSPSEPISTGIACVNSHEVLKRNDSSGGMLKNVEEKVTKDSYNQSVSVSNVILKPGKNTVEVLCTGITPGNYKPGQAGVKVNQLELIKDMASELSVMVTCDETFCEIIPEMLLAGSAQEVTVFLHAGHVPIDPGSRVKVMPSDDLYIDTCYPNNTVILEEEVLRGNTTEWKMKIFQEPDVTGGTTIDNKDLLKCQGCGGFWKTGFLVKPQRIAYDCSWLPRPLLTTVTFKNPFQVAYRLYTVREMKYIQVNVQGQCETQFVLKDWSLTADTCKDVELIGMNKPGSQLKVNTDQRSSFIWQLKSNIAQISTLDLTFTSHYQCIMQDGEELRQFQYQFSLSKFQTLYTVKAEVTPNGENKVCKTGTLSTLKIHVLEMPVNKPLSDHDLMYEVIGQSNWNMHGISTGLFTVTGGSYTTNLQVMPLMSGFIPLPKIKLYMYNGAKKSDIWEKGSVSKDEVLDSTDEESSDSDQVTDRIDFNEGQVYYTSLGKQVQIYPVEVVGDVEVTVV